VIDDTLRHDQSLEAVVEIERVSAVLTPEFVRVADPATAHFTDINSRKPRFEIHHFADLPLAATVDFRNWTKSCSDRGISVGGWFKFDKQSVSAFRSVRFEAKPDILRLMEETRQINELACELGGNSSVETIVEQILEMWRVRD
jgi:hypothetical protein